MDRLKVRMEQDRSTALFGDNPPPPRQPAPYPEGDIIHHRQHRYIVRHRNGNGAVVTKYTTHSYGMGANNHPNEASVLRFVKENTTIPVPSVISSDWDRITMEYIEGSTLRQAWPTLTDEQRLGILAQLKGYIAQLCALRGKSIGRLDGQGAMVPSIMMRSGGPFTTVAEFHNWLVRPPKGAPNQTIYWHQITKALGKEYPVVFTHGDIAARNIMVQYWEYVFSMRGLDNIDWESLGERVPSLFDQRYDLEYILLHFILQLS
ncbi:kinase-like domain-containing protein [Echria macrotheca]|uniref:Kinase-like domain-containing protein n=1 Tax=Echria macrotheca TaxID=438768 RepID=A0AAJ0F8A2_9PEZI|nr:kinase-like domain-containing protein [Echria macrotheca]